MNVNTQEFKEVLQEALILDMEEKGSRILTVNTFGEAGPTRKEMGLMIRTIDGSVFRLVIDKIG